MIVGDHPEVRELIQLAVREDLGSGDITSQLIHSDIEHASFDVVAKQPGVLSGQEVGGAVLSAYDAAINIEWAAAFMDGTAWADFPTTLATISGPAATVLSAERVLLNFLQRLCGVATLTRTFAEAAAGTSAVIMDTRKTIPGWRVLDKYAVRCGGGENHRFGLHDAVLIKDNHLAGTPLDRLGHTIFEMLNGMHARGITPTFVEVEADSLAQITELLKVVGIDVILLDNFTNDELRAAVAMRDDAGLADRVKLEASGGITLDTVRAVAETGVDRISVGALTHSATAIDLSMERV